MLDLCSSCTRHVHRAEPRCPFCGSALTRTHAITSGRLGRTALLALVACGGPPPCPKQSSSPAMQIVTLPDGGTEVTPTPIAIYGTVPPCK